jgi:suppressor of ftsI
MPTRREFLLVAALGAVGLTAGCFSSPDGVPFGGITAPSGGDLLTPPKGFDGRALPIPPVLEPDGAGRYVLRAQPGTTELVAGLRTRTWGFNGAMLGPTIRAPRGERVRMHVENAVDETTSVHWHGMILPAAMDGGPHQPIAPGGVWDAEWMIDQPAATLWYHPHPHGTSADHVYRGLAGMFLVDEPDVDTGLPAEYGVDDVPLILQDRTLDRSGALSWDEVALFGLLGGTMIVNGVHAPTFTATRRLIRFRVLAASTARMFRLAFSDDREFAVVATDAGLMSAPVPVRTVALSPGERIEIVVAIEPGDNVVLQTRAGTVDIDTGDYDLLRILGAVSPETPPDGTPQTALRSALPSTLPAEGPVRTQAGAERRTFRLNGDDAINGAEMSLSRIDTVVPRGATEVWEVINPVYAHNFHIHGCSFTVLEVDGAQPPRWMSGRKDTVFVPPRSSVLLAVAFADYVDEQNPYMYHCHILRHEDEGMMGQFLVVDRGRVDKAPRVLEMTGHGH